MQSVSTPVLKSGWLTKQGGFIKTWRRRWFELKGGTLYYYKEPDEKVRGTIAIDSARRIERAPECSKQPAFKIDVPKQRVFYIYGDSEEVVEEWIKVLQSAQRGESAKEKSQICEKDFEKIRVIGRGTYGKVSLVRHIKTGKIYAMKVMSKRLLEEYDQIEQILTERNVLLKTEFPFLVSAHYTFQTEEKIFMVIDYVPGGELFSRLKEEHKFSEGRAMLYAAEILLGIGHLHSLGFVYRDLKPENILVDAEGHLKITDFGLVKGKMSASVTTSTFCGTPEYIAPEILQQLPYTKAVDWWSFGILLFEMLTGFPPFYDDNMTKMYRSIINDPISYPHYISPNAVNLLTRLLEKNPAQRLGSSERGVEEIKEHPFFASVDWDDVLNKRTKPEWVPKLVNDTDTGNFSEAFTTECVSPSNESGFGVSHETQRNFVGFTCTDESRFNKD
jgi:RAC serine/threonine-protein kinase